LQGADILATAVGAQVFMPDFFGEGNEFGIGKLPPKNEQDKKDLDDFFKTFANIPTTVTRLINFAKVLKGEGFKKIGALGYCFGDV
jgi:dienelactone hydrolase